MSRFSLLTNQTFSVEEAYKPHVNHVFHPEDKEACDEEFAELSLKIKPVGFNIIENDYRLPPNTENYYDDSCVGIAIFQKAKSTNEKTLEDWLDKLNKKCDFCSFQAYKFDDTKFYITAYFD